MKTWKENNCLKEYEDKKSSKKRVREGFLSKAIDRAKVKGFKALGGREALAREIEDYKNHPEKYAHSPLKGMVDALLIQRGYMDEDHNWIETDFEDDDAYYIDEDDYEALEDDYEEDDYEDDYEDFGESKKSSKNRVREEVSTLGMSMKDSIEHYLKIEKARERR